MYRSNGVSVYRRDETRLNMCKDWAGNYFTRYTNNRAYQNKKNKGN